MDILSVLLLGLIGLWFVWALRRVIRNGTCGCGGKKKCRCTGCSGMGTCKKQ